MTLRTVVVTEIITHVRVWRVEACDVGDAVNVVAARGLPRIKVLKRVKCVSNVKQTRWAGAVAVPRRGEK